MGTEARVLQHWRHRCWGEDDRRRRVPPRRVPLALALPTLGGATTFSERCRRHAVRSDACLSRRLHRRRSRLGNLWSPVVDTRDRLQGVRRGGPSARLNRRRHGQERASRNLGSCGQRLVPVGQACSVRILAPQDEENAAATATAVRPRVVSGCGGASGAGDRASWRRVRSIRLVACRARLSPRTGFFVGAVRVGKDPERR